MCHLFLARCVNVNNTLFKLWHLRVWEPTSLIQKLLQAAGNRNFSFPDPKSLLPAKIGRELKREFK
jgi:hypothetical protein